MIVRPLQAGTLHVAWAVVGHDGCREVDTDNGSGGADIRVEATGLPEIVVNDFAGVDPKERIYSPAGNRIIEVYDGRYRIIDELSHAEITERPGLYPRFSPTGRYVAAYVEDGIGMEAVDTVDGKLAFTSTLGSNLAWDDADSFAILDRGGYGSVAIFAPSLADPVVLEGAGSCHACTGVDSIALRVDLENNVAVFAGDQAMGAASLTVEAKTDALDNDFTNGSMEGQIIAFVDRQSRVTKFALPKVWELHGGLKFSHVGGTFFQDDQGDVLAKFVVKPLTESVRSGATVLASTVEPDRWRGLGGQAPVAISDRNILKRLVEFGIPIAPQAEDPSQAVFARETMSNPDDTALVQSMTDKLLVRIKREAPAASSTFVAKDSQDYSSCWPQSYDAGKRYFGFQTAFRFSRDARTIWVTHQTCLDGSGGYDYSSLALFDSTNPAPWLLDLDTGRPDSNGNGGNLCSDNVGMCDLDIQIFGDRLLVLSSQGARAIEIYDLIHPQERLQEIRPAARRTFEDRSSSRPMASSSCRSIPTAASSAFAWPTQPSSSRAAMSTTRWWCGRPKAASTPPRKVPTMSACACPAASAPTPSSSSRRS